jgi:hypothetical protein
MTTDWTIGYVIGGVVVLAVVVLVGAILILARQIGDEAPKINAALEGAVRNTEPLGALRHDHHRRAAARPRPAGRVAMNPTEHTLWVSVIIVGFVVVVAVAALLSLLIYLIKRIDRRVDTIGATLTAAKANTADTVLIPQVATGVDAVLAEGLEHHLFLGRVLDKVKS